MTDIGSRADLVADIHCPPDGPDRPGPARRRPALRRPSAASVGMVASMLGAILIISAFSVGDEDGAPLEAALVAASRPDSASGAAEPAGEPRQTFKPIVLSGTGNAVQEVSLPASLTDGVVVSTTHSGQSNLVVWALDQNLQQSELLVNEIGEYTGETLMAPGARALRVEADGPWTISIAPVDSVPTFSTELSGSGSSVVGYRGGEAALTVTHDGVGSFAVWEYPASGVGRLVVNEVGAFTGRATLGAGPSVIVIESDGAWSVGAA